MLGGGNFITQNKVLPGCYINFVSAAVAKSLISDRGVAAVPVIMDWGPEKAAYEVSAEDFQLRSMKILGYTFDDAVMLPFRELFRNLTSAVVYRLNTGTKAANDFATAKYSGSRGNAVTVIIKKNVDNDTRYDIRTLFAGAEVDLQTVTKAADLKDNVYVDWKKDATLAETAGMPLTGGTETKEVTGEDYAAFLEAMENHSYQILCCPSTEDSVKALFAAYAKRMRDEVGVKFQTVMYRYTEADHEGVISIENKAAGNEPGLVYWVSGAEAACAINRTTENKVYDGELVIDTAYTQKQLTDAIQSGKYIFHKCGDQVRVLMDINSLTTFTADKGDDFGNNQTIRVLDQIGNDIASLFNTRYLGVVPNDESGRTALWNDIVTYNKELVKIRAIEAFETKNITIAVGDSKRSVVVNCPVTPINCMSQLYMTVVVQ